MFSTAKFDEIKFQVPTGGIVNVLINVPRFPFSLDALLTIQFLYSHKSLPQPYARFNIKSIDWQFFDEESFL